MTTLTQTQGSWPLAADSIKRSRLQTAVLWLAQIGLAAMFLMAGTGKLSSAPEMVRAFEVIGAGQWFRYFTGGIEVVSAFLLLVPSLAAFGAVALAVTMVGAILTHIVILGGSFLVPLVLLVVASAVAWSRRRSFVERSS